MNFVEPIRDIGKIQTMKHHLRGNPRNELLFIFGINSALRVSDLLRLKVGDVVDETQSPRSAVSLRERKTGKTKRFPLNESIKTALAHYLDACPSVELNAPLFPSRKGGALTRKQAWAILQEAGKKIGLCHIGTHSLRKTFAYHVYRKTNDLAMVQQLLGHSTSADTLRYIGITQEQLFDAYLGLNL